MARPRELSPKPKLPNDAASSLADAFSSPPSASSLADTPHGAFISLSTRWLAGSLGAALLKRYSVSPVPY